MRNPTGQRLEGLREAPRALYEAPSLRALRPGAWERLFWMVSSCLSSRREGLCSVRELRYRNVYQWSKHWDAWDGG